MWLSAKSGVRVWRGAHTGGERQEVLTSQQLSKGLWATDMVLTSKADVGDEGRLSRPAA